MTVRTKVSTSPASRETRKFMVEKKSWSLMKPGVWGPSSKFQHGLRGLFAERKAGVAEIVVEGSLAAVRVHRAKGLAKFKQRRGLGVGPVLRNLHGLLGHLEFLLGVG